MLRDCSLVFFIIGEARGAEDNPQIILLMWIPCKLEPILDRGGLNRGAYRGVYRGHSRGYMKGDT